MWAPQPERLPLVRQRRVHPRYLGNHPNTSPDAISQLRSRKLLLSFDPLPGNRSGLRPANGTTMPSADFSHEVRADYSTLSQFQSHATSQGTWETSQGKTQNSPCVDAGFIKHTQTADGGLRCHVPTRPECTTPHIRFLFVAPHFWIGLPPDPTSR